MWWTVMIAGLSLGAISSLHCVGMCGPLALAMPVHHLSKFRQFISLLLYQFGRIITYSSFGLIVGIAGRGIYLAGFQQWFSIIMGIIILALVILYWVFKHTLKPFVLSGLFSHVQSWLAGSFRKKRSSAQFLLIGMINGLLPCTMVYVAIAGALTTGKIYYSVLFMAMFGAGTLPAMMVIGYFGRMASLRVRNLFRQSIPFFMSAIGIVLILRGMNLGIPFISPVLPGPAGAVVSCHP